MFSQQPLNDENSSTTSAPNAASKISSRKEILEAQKGLAALASNARRNVLGDKSNVVFAAESTSAAIASGGVVTAASLTASTRNLRSSTLQQTNLLTRSKFGTSTAPANEPATTFDKENIDPAPKSRVAATAALPGTKANLTGTSAKPDWDDLDAEDAEDPLMVSEYVREIFSYMRQVEPRIMPNPKYIDNQKELNWHMRSVLIDWLIEVQWKLKLLPETLFLTVNIIDRFLSNRVVSLVKLQLVGLAATLLASKYEEVLSPSIANFIYLADNSYDEQELLKAERYMLHVLDFNLTYPSPLVYLRRISKAESYDVRSRTLAKYLMEVALLDQRFLACPPSLLAATAVYVAREMLKSGPWTPNLRHYSGEYSESADIKSWAEALLEYFKRPVVYEAVFKKYASKKLMKASLFVQEYMKRNYGTPTHTVSSTKSVFDA